MVSKNYKKDSIKLKEYKKSIKNGIKGKQIIKAKTNGKSPSKENKKV